MKTDSTVLPVLEGYRPPKPVSSPHAHDRSSVETIMLQVCFALTPATGFGLYLFGWPAVNLFVITCLSAVLTEALCLKAAGGSVRRVLDGSALLTGWLLAMSIPPWAPWWIGVGGAAFAIAVGKHLYGGVGQNVFNPAMLARVALLVSFPLQMSTWALPVMQQTHMPGFLDGLRITFGGGPLPDGVSGATPLGHLRTAFTLHQDARDVLGKDFSPEDAWLGRTGGSLGETSELLVLIGAGWLLWRRLVSWDIPLAMLGTVAALATLANAIQPGRYAGAVFHLGSGGLMLGAFFIATDPVTSPITRTGRLVFGAGCGLVTWIIRSWGSFPEAVGFAVLFMNALTPLMDRYIRPRAYGRTTSGKPLVPLGATSTVKRSDNT